MARFSKKHFYLETQNLENNKFCFYSNYYFWIKLTNVCLRCIDFLKVGQKNNDDGDDDDDEDERKRKGKRREYIYTYIS